MMRRMPMALILTALWTPAFAGSDAGYTPPEAADSDPSGIVCSKELRAGLAISVTEAGSGRSLADAATVTIRADGETETLRANRNGVFSGAFEQPGRYDVTVEAEGYETWQQENVVVTADECHVKTVRLDARLQPAATPTPAPTPSPAPAQSQDDGPGTATLVLAGLALAGLIGGIVYWLKARAG